MSAFLFAGVMDARGWCCRTGVGSCRCRGAHRAGCWGAGCGARGHLCVGWVGGSGDPRSAPTPSPHTHSPWMCKGEGVLGEAPAPVGQGGFAAGAGQLTGWGEGRHLAEVLLSATPRVPGASARCWSSGPQDNLGFCLTTREEPVWGGQLRRLATVAPDGLGTSLCTLTQGPPTLRAALTAAQMCTLGGRLFHTTASPDPSQVHV